MELLKERFEWFAAFCYSQWRCRPNDLIVEAKKKLLSMVRYHELLRHEDHVCGISNREKCVPADYRRHSPTWNSSRNSFFFPFSSTPLHPCSNFFRHFRRQCQRDRELEILRSEDTRRESLDDWLQDVCNVQIQFLFGWQFGVIEREQSTMGYIVDCYF